MVDVPDNDVFYRHGRCDGILYTTKRDGKTEHYIHEFRGRAAPDLAVSACGDEIRLLGGNFCVTDAGIVDNE